MSIQELIAFALVGLAGIYLVRKFYFQYAAMPLSNFLLKRNHVRLAMRVRAGAKKAGCGGDCKCD